MKKIFTLFLLILPFFAMAERGPNYEYVITVTGISTSSDLKQVYETLKGLDFEMIIGHVDDLTEVRFKSDLRFLQSDIASELTPLGVTITNFTGANIGLQQSVLGP